MSRVGGGALDESLDLETKDRRARTEPVDDPLLTSSGLGFIWYGHVVERVAWWLACNEAGILRCRLQNGISCCGEGVRVAGDMFAMPICGSKSLPVIRAKR
jgi:hypothetical protein